MQPIRTCLPSEETSLSEPDGQYIGIFYFGIVAIETTSLYEAVDIP
jgi:hypothetical protein